MTSSGDRRARIGAALAASALVAAFLGGAFVLLLMQAADAPALAGLFLDHYFRGVVFFTLEQAILSTLLSVGLAIPLAVALHRARFAGRDLVLRLFLLPQALPVLVGALAIITVWGRNGVVSNVLTAIGLPALDPYGLPGILIAHVFFNMPLAARLMIAALSAVPAESWKLAGQLSFRPAATFLIVEWPAIRRALPGAASLVFMLCVTSFTLVLTLGGGPNATTLEVAIYQALRYDFDPGRAVVLALLQIALTTAFLAATFRLGGQIADAFTLGRPPIRYDRRSPVSRAFERVIIAAGTLFVLSPFLAVLVSGLQAELWRLAHEESVQRAALTSLAIALASAAIALPLSLALVLGAQAASGSHKGPWRRRMRPVFEMTGSLVLVVPPIVVGAGWFVGLRQVTNVFFAAPYMVVAINAVMAMPFAVRILGPAIAASAARHDRLAESLGLFGLARLRHVDWPALRGPLGLAFAIALALSLGDLGAIALFGSQDLVTLPYLLLQRMGSYRTADAAGLALMLGVLCLALILVAERGLTSRRSAS